jgi:hypothetical protein
MTMTKTCGAGRGVAAGVAVEAGDDALADPLGEGEPVAVATGAAAQDTTRAPIRRSGYARIH